MNSPAHSPAAYATARKLRRFVLYPLLGLVAAAMVIGGISSAVSPKAEPAQAPSAPASAPAAQATDQATGQTCAQTWAPPAKVKLLTDLCPQARHIYVAYHVCEQAHARDFAHLPHRDFSACRELPIKLSQRAITEAAHETFGAQS